VQGDGQGLDERAIGKARRAGQPQDLALRGQSIFAIAAADQLHLIAPGRLTAQATGAIPAALDGRNGDTIADAKPCNPLAYRDDLACELVAQDRARRDLERGLLGHVQVRAADAAAADLDHDFAKPRRRIHNALNT
jgi:hypothetical protein